MYTTVLVLLFIIKLWKSPKKILWTVSLTVMFPGLLSHAGLPVECWLCTAIVTPPVMHPPVSSHVTPPCNAPPCFLTCYPPVMHFSVSSHVTPPVTPPCFLTCYSCLAGIVG